MGPVVISCQLFALVCIELKWAAGELQYRKHVSYWQKNAWKKHPLTFEEKSFFQTQRKIAAKGRYLVLYDLHVFLSLLKSQLTA